MEHYDALFDEDEEEEDIFAITAIMALNGYTEAREIRNQRRRLHRLYLRRADLLPNPRESTPWHSLWNNRNDRAFITTMGFDVKTFSLLLEGPGRFAEGWDLVTIPREDVNRHGEPRPYRRSLDAAGALGLVLHYLGSSMLEVTLQQIFALTPSALSRYLSFSQKILYKVLSSIPEAAICMPRTRAEFERLSALIQTRHPLLEGAFGSIDGLSLPAQESDDPELENATYNGWKSSHRINNVLIFSPSGEINYAVFNAPGSWHDAKVARPAYDKLRTSVPQGFYLVADSGFLKGNTYARDKIKSPLKGGDDLPANPAVRNQVIQFNQQLVSYRQSDEWGMRTLQGSFGRLRVPLKISDSSSHLRRQLLESCARLTNVRARCVGISEIRNVYMPIWNETDDEHMWLEFGDMMFKDIRCRNRVARFHLVVR